MIPRHICCAASRITLAVVLLSIWHGAEEPLGRDNYTELGKCGGVFCKPVEENHDGNSEGIS